MQKTSSNQKRKARKRQEMKSKYPHFGCTIYRCKGVKCGLYTQEQYDEMNPINENDYWSVV